MSFDWNDYINLAKGLIEEPGDFKEAALRSAVSRVYFAGYNIALAYAIEKDNFNPYYIDSHKQLRNHFQYETKKVRISTQLGRLQQWRKKCDYDPTVDNLETHIIPSVVNRVANLISLLN